MGKSTKSKAILEDVWKYLEGKKDYASLHNIKLSLFYPVVIKERLNYILGIYCDPINKDYLQTIAYSLAVYKLAAIYGKNNHKIEKK